jgi:hypothetical protein
MRGRFWGATAPLGEDYSPLLERFSAIRRELQKGQLSNVAIARLVVASARSKVPTRRAA